MHLRECGKGCGLQRLYDHADHHVESTRSNPILRNCGRAKEGADEQGCDLRVCLTQQLTAKLMRGETADAAQMCEGEGEGGTEIGGAPQDDAGACCGDQAADYQRPHTPAHEGEGYADHAANDIGDYAPRRNGPVAEIRSKERRVGKEWVSEGRTRWS